MRTTVNIDADVLAVAKQVATRAHRSLGSVMEDALRCMLASLDERAGDRSIVTLPAHGCGGVRSGVDLDNTEQLAELLGDDEPTRAPA